MRLGPDFEEAIKALRSSEEYLEYESSKPRTKNRSDLALKLGKRIAKSPELGRARDLAVPYARWLDTQELLKNADTVIIENAVKTYDEIYDAFYEGINDFLIAHGYPPIGFIKGYAPHMQQMDVQESLVSALMQLGEAGFVFDALHRRRITLNINSRFFLKFIYEIVNDDIIKIFTAKVRITIGGHHLKYTVTKFKN